ncbi:MAG: phosphoglycerate mutase family protein [Gemmatimonadaceae bacterium]
MILARRALFLLAALAVALPSASAQGRPAGDKLVYIVRHAEKANATDADPSLSEVGKARANALAYALRDAGVTSILVTARKRTAETAAPLATALELTMHVVPFGAGVAEHAALTVKAIAEQHGGAVLVVGHSNTVTAIIAALGGPRMPELCDAAYANLFIVHLPASGPPTLVRSRFGADDHAESATCAGMTMR